MLLICLLDLGNILISILQAKTISIRYLEPDGTLPNESLNLGHFLLIDQGLHCILQLFQLEEDYLGFKKEIHGLLKIEYFNEVDG